MKLAALCCTFRRPHTLGQLMESYLRQDYPRELRELVILDDAGQYENQSGDGWRLVSIEQAQSMDRHRVRDQAAEQFDTDRIVGSIITAVNKARLGGGIEKAGSV